MFPQHMRDDDVYDEDEVRHLLQTGSESEYENISTEMGYDADSEETNFDETEKGLCFYTLHTKICGNNPKFVCIFAYF